MTKQINNRSPELKLTTFAKTAIYARIVESANFFSANGNIAETLA